MNVWLRLAGLVATVLAAEPETDEPGRPRVAAVTIDGAIAVSEDRARSWTVIHRCAGEPVTAADGVLASIEGLGQESGRCDPRRPAAIAWAAGALYIACEGEPLRRWDPTSRSVGLVSPAVPGPIATLGTDWGEPGEDRPGSAGDRSRLLIADGQRRIWIYDPRRGAGYVARAPRGPVAAVAARGHALYVAGPTAVWRHADAWEPVVTTAACALAIPRARASGQKTDYHLVAAGPDGLIGVRGDTVAVLSIIPFTAAIAIGGELVLADRHSGVVRWRDMPVSEDANLDTGRWPVTRDTSRWPVTQMVASAPSAAAVRGPPATLAELAKRRSRARWVPGLTLAVTVRVRSDHAPLVPLAHDRPVEFWCWFTWKLPEEIDP